MMHPTYSIFTHSVGYHTAHHSLLSKLDAIAAAGIGGVELFTDDLWAFSQSLEFASIVSGGSTTLEAELLTPPDSPLSRPAFLHKSLSRPSVAGQRWYNAYGECSAEQAALEVAAARFIARYCKERRLKVVCLQPLRDVEGWLDDDDRREAMDRLTSRFAVMQALDTALLLICSQNTPAPRTTANVATLVADFTQISHLAAEFTRTTGHMVKVGFEALSWGAHVDVWSQAWQVVQRTDRCNIGLILDSFNTLAREYADPCSSSGVQEPASVTLAALDASLRGITQLPGDKIFLLQIGDAKRMPEPLLPSPSADEPRPSRMIWSRSSRLFPCEQERGAFMPVPQFVKAVVQAGYKGPWSIEVFNSTLESGADEVPSEHATRAREGLDRLVELVFA